MAEAAKRKKVTYCKSWEKTYKWLLPVPTREDRARCKACNSDMCADISTIRDHDSKSQKHKKNVGVLVPYTSNSMANFITIVHLDTTKVLELRLAAFIAEHTSIRSVDHLSELISNSVSDSKTVKNLKLHRTKCRKLITYVLAPCLKEELIMDIGHSYYSLLLDESTDTSTLKMLALVIRYFSISKGLLITSFYRMIELNGADAISISNCIVEALDKDKLEIKKLIGIGTDGASVMTGCTNSVYVHLKKQQKDLILMPCVCHSLHLCASFATQPLPLALEDMVDETYNWFARSSKKFSHFQEIYKTVIGSLPKKFVRRANTRWLSHYECITRIIDAWDPLTAYFKEAATKERNMKCTRLAEAFSDKTNLAYLKFLMSFLKDFQCVNLAFQSENANPFKLIEDLKDLYMKLLQKVVVPSRLDQVTPHTLRNFPFEQYIMHDTGIKYGYEMQIFLEENVDPNKHYEIKRRCKCVLIEAITQVQKRLPNCLDNFILLEYLNPNRALSKEGENILPLLKMFRNVVPNIDSVMCQMALLSTSKYEWNTKTPVEFWCEVYSSKDAMGVGKFNDVSKFALGMLSLPLSNAAVERVFSIMNIVKDKLRNRMQLLMLESILRVRYSLKIRKENCLNITITKDMMDRFSNKMYVEDESEEEAVMDEVYEYINESEFNCIN